MTNPNFARALSGLFPAGRHASWGRCHSGSVEFKGRTIARFSPCGVNRLGIGRTFQDLRLATQMTVAENIMLALEKRMFSRPSKEQRLRVDAILDKVSLTDKRNERAGEISYGQQKLLSSDGCIANDADLLLLGSLVVISACLPNVYGIYGGVTVFSNLFLFVTAQASAGKGRLSLCRRLVEPIHRQLREINKLELDEYRRQQAEYAANKKNPDAEQPQKPPLRVLFVPANSSATAVFQILNDNNGVGLMFETEGDTMAQTFKSEHGNYSDGFRKAFHHEKISYLRRKDREYITLENPKLSALLSGTPRQVQSLIPDAENGLFSRFMFYYMNIRLQWIDVFACNEHESLDQRFNRFGDMFFEFYQTLKQYENIRFSLSNSQQTAFNQYFEQVQQQYWELLGNDYIGTIRRLGLITFRITMILTTLRLMDNGGISQTLVCSDTDFQTALSIVKVLIQHARLCVPAVAAGNACTSHQPQNGTVPSLAATIRPRTIHCRCYATSNPRKHRRQTNCPLS